MVPWLSLQAQATSHSTSWLLAFVGMTLPNPSEPHSANAGTNWEQGKTLRTMTPSSPGEFRHQEKLLYNVQSILLLSLEALQVPRQGKGRDPRSLGGEFEVAPGASQSSSSMRAQRMQVSVLVLQVTWGPFQAPSDPPPRSLCQLSTAPILPLQVQQLLVSPLGSSLLPASPRTSLPPGSFSDGTPALAALLPCLLPTLLQPQGSFW